MVNCATTCDECARRFLLITNWSQYQLYQRCTILSPCPPTPTPSAHRNDLENNLLIISIAFMYLLTDPQLTVAVNLMRTIVAFRCWHSLVYGVFPIRQPARSIGFLVPWTLMAYMAAAVLWRFIAWI